MNTIIKKFAVSAAALAFSSAVDKASPRPTGTYPTPRRLGTVIAGVVALNYGLAWLERQLELHD